jgi:hypothetical protein
MICSTVGFQKPGIYSNQESEQIPGFWNPMVRKGAMEFFSDQ